MKTSIPSLEALTSYPWVVRDELNCELRSDRIEAPVIERLPSSIAFETRVPKSHQHALRVCNATNPVVVRPCRVELGWKLIGRYRRGPDHRAGGLERCGMTACDN